MPIAVIDPCAGISGDMTLGALLSLGVPGSWLAELPGRLGLDGVHVTIRDVRRAAVGCTQVEFAIPEQPHGRHVAELVRLVEHAPVSEWVKERAVRAFEQRLDGAQHERQGRAKLVADVGEERRFGAIEFRKSLKDSPITIQGDGKGPVQLLMDVEHLETFPSRDRLGTLVTLRDAETRREIGTQTSVATMAAPGRSAKFDSAAW